MYLVIITPLCREQKAISLLSEFKQWFYLDTVVTLMEDRHFFCLHIMSTELTHKPPPLGFTFSIKPHLAWEDFPGFAIRRRDSHSKWLVHRDMFLYFLFIYFLFI